MGRSHRDDTSPGSSRARTDDLLFQLASRRWRPAAWAQLLGSAAVRSLDQARHHPRALAQTTVLHVCFLAVAPSSGRGWISSSWLLAGTHMGLLEEHADLGLANTLTLVRGNLPAVVAARPPWLGSLALATDFLDGRLARRTGTTTSFGSYADAFADAAFWIWFAAQPDERRAVRAAAFLTWLLPVGAVTALSFRRGRMIEPPRPRWIRPAATLQVLLAARALLRNQRRHG